MAPARSHAGLVARRRPDLEEDLRGGNQGGPVGPSMAPASRYAASGSPPRHRRRLRPRPRIRPGPASCRTQAPERRAARRGRFLWVLRCAFETPRGGEIRSDRLLSYPSLFIRPVRGGPFSFLLSPFSLSSCHASITPSASRSQVRRGVAGRRRRGPPRGRHHSPPSPRAHRRRGVRDGGHHRRAPGRGRAGGRRRCPHGRSRSSRGCAAATPKRRGPCCPRGAAAPTSCRNHPGLHELEALAQGLRLLRELTPRTTDYHRVPRRAAQRALVAAALEAAGTRPGTSMRST